MSRPSTPPSARPATSAARELLEARVRAGRPSRTDGGGRAPALARGAPDGPQPLSFAQQRLWFLDQLEPGTSAYHIARAWTIEGPLDRRGLALALSRLAARHPALRTVFLTSLGETWQRILPAPPPRLPTVDLGALGTADREAVELALARAEAQRPFDLAADPALRALLVARADRSALLLLTVHHIAADGGSMPVLYRDLAALYRETVESGPSLVPPEPAVFYASYAAWQRRRLDGERLESLLAFWRRELEGAPQVLELPADRPRPRRPSQRGGAERLALPPATVQALGRRARELQATPFMVLLAGFATLLWRYTGKRDLLLGTPVLDRPRRELEQVVGVFVNTVVLRLRPRAETAFAALVGEARERAVAAYAHQELPFERLVEELTAERDRSRSALFQVMFLGLDGGEGSLALPGLAVRRRGLAREESKFDLSLAVIEEGGASFLHAQYATDLFDAGRIQRLLGHLANLLVGAVEDPRSRLVDLPLASAAERQELAAWGSGPAEAMPEVSVGALCRAGARDREDAVAVAWGAEQWSSAGLWSQVDGLAARLRDEGLAPEEVVAVALERTPLLVMAALAVVEAGGVYLPLDPALPPARVAAMLEDARPTVLLVEDGPHPNPLPQAGEGAGGDEATWRVLVLRADELAPSGEVGLCETFSEPLARRRERGRGEGFPHPDQAAYVIFTSGSTGRPKGVVVSHRAIVNRICWGGEAYPLRPSDAVMQGAAIGFDYSVWELLAPLAAGARLVLPTPGASRDPLALAAELADSRATIAHFVPSLMAVFLDAAVPDPAFPGTGLLGAATGLRLVFAGGEALPAELARRFRAASPAELWNQYGPTEATVDATFLRCDDQALAAGPGTVPIGRPIANLEVRVAGPGALFAGESAAAGVPGELLLAGAGLARGYLGRPAATAERFLPAAWARGEGARAYRTGDLVRWAEVPTGGVLEYPVLEYLGRIDSQVKLRGIRIEPEEVERVLAAAPGVGAAVVLAREDGGETRLVAYLVPAATPAPTTVAAGPDVAALRAFAAERLPEAMVPAAFVLLPALPLTATGKLDRRALPAPEWRGVAAERLAPRTAAEEAMVSLWAEVLGRPPESIGVEDDFFALGGHSLLATRLVARLGARLGTAVPLATVFDRPTPAALAAAVAELGRGERLPDLELVPRHGDLPLSFSQERLWVLARLDPQSTAYNIAGSLLLTGEVSAAVLRRSLSEIVRRHEVLRTTFHPTPDGPRQRIGLAVPVQIPVVDLCGLGGEAREREARRCATGVAAHRFDLEHGPLLACRLLLLDVHPRRSRLLLNQPHIVSDGWSIGILLAELAALYPWFSQGFSQGFAQGFSQGSTQGPAAGRPSPLPELAFQYADFAAWQRRWHGDERLADQLAYWRRRLAGAPPALELPTDWPRTAARASRGGRLRRELPAELRAAVLGFAEQERATLFMVLLAALTALLSRLSGQGEVVVGAPVAGRTRREVEPLIGCFLNQLALRLDLGGRPTFRQLVRQAREVALGAFAHQDLPFERLLSELDLPRDLSRTPVFQVLLNVLNFAALRRGDGELAFEVEGAPEATAKFDLTLYVAESDGTLGWTVVYNADRFARQRMEIFLDQLAGLLAQAVAEPDRPLAAHSLVTPGSRGRLPDPTAELPDAWHGSVAEIFRRRALAEPARQAIADPRVAWTYGELREASERVAAALTAGGLAVGERVAIFAHRSAPLAAAFLGGLQAGGVCLILDPAYPRDRLVELVELARPRALVALVAAGPLPEGLAVALERVGCAVRVELPAARAGERWAERELPAVGRIAGGPVARVEVGPRSPAVVGFTSGSTGRPQAVLGAHGSLSHFLPVWQARWEIGPGDRMTMLSGLAHDPLQRDLLVPLCLGAAVVVPDPERLAEPGYLAGWAREAGATLANLTPAMAQLFATPPPARPQPPVETLRAAFVVGEALRRRDVARLRQVAPRARLINLYGATETQRALACHEVEPDEPHEVISLGTGMEGCQLLVVSEAGALAGVGEEGEIAIRSPHLALGYLGDDEATSRRFLPSPWGARQGDRLYLTGDRGRFLPNGEVSFAGRADRQVKVRGFRVELEEVEAVLGRLPGVAQVVAVAREDAELGTRLAAYLVPAAAELDLGLVRRELEARLPAYMVPAALVPLAALPLNPHGKLDRRALPMPEWGAEPRWGSAGGGAAALASPLERLLAGVWRPLLKVEEIGPEDDFFALGGHSLLATMMAARVHQALGVAVPLRQFFERPTVRALAEAIAGRGASPPLAGGGGERRPASYQQERLRLMADLEAFPAEYHLPAAWRLSGALDVAALARAWRQTLDRHPVLRSGFEVDQGAVWQRARPVAELAERRLAVIDLTRLDGADRVRLAGGLGAGLALGQAEAGFDLARGPLARARLLRLAAAEHRLLLTVHRLAADERSLRLLGAELRSLYQEPAVPLASTVAMADLAEREREAPGGEALATMLAWWREALAGAPALLALPTDRPRPAVERHRGDAVPVPLPPGTLAALAGASALLGTAPEELALAAYAALLGRWSGQEDVVIGWPWDAREARGDQAGGARAGAAIGPLTQLLPVRLEIGAAGSFAKLALHARTALVAAWDRRELRFERLLADLQPQRDLSFAPVFQVTLAWSRHPAEPSPGGDGPSWEAEDLPPRSALHDLALELAEVAGELCGRLVFNRDLFDATTMLRFGEQWARLLAEGAAGPPRSLASLLLPGPAERHLGAIEWNDRPLPAGETPSISARVSHWARLQPDAVAVRQGVEHTSYGFLDQASLRLAARFTGLGVGPEVVVGLCLERGAYLPLVLLSVLRAGGAYVPLDPGFPAARLAHMLADSGARLLLVEGSTAAAVDVAGLEPPPRVVRWEELSRSIVAATTAPATNSEWALRDCLLYILYTSGSTGRPKGVGVTRGALEDLLAAMAAWPMLSRGEGMLAVTTLSFDIAEAEMYLPLAVGGRIELVRRETALDGRELAATVRDSRAALLNATPATYRLLLAAGWEGEPLLRCISTGEAMPPEFLHTLLPRVGELWNLYGPTETTIWSSYGRVHPGEKVSIGRVMEGEEAWIVAPGGQACPIGVPGELLLTGKGLARGYLGRPALTAERFVPDCASGRPGARAYRTGDLARWKTDGRIEVLGRIDTQVKIRGFRIELGEIEAVAVTHEAVRQAVALVRQVATPGRPADAADPRLVLYVVPPAGAEPPTVAALRTCLGTHLPEYMVPAAVLVLPELPLTPSGKVDKRSLPDPEWTLAGDAHEAPRTGAEELLAGVWAEVLGVPRVGVSDDFFALGGHSLLGTQVLARLRELLGIELPLRLIFEHPTVAAFAAEIGARGRGDDEVPAISPAPAGTPILAAFGQRAMWFLEQVGAGGSAFNMPSTFVLTGQLRVRLLAEALGEVVRRHQALRTTFELRGEELYLVVGPPGGFRTPLVDLTGLCAADREREDARLVQVEGRRRFDLAHDLLIRVSLVRLCGKAGAEIHRLLFNQHHIAGDGWSLQVLAAEWGELYAAALDERPARLEPLPIQYGDYALWQHRVLTGERLERMLGWWREQLGDAPDGLDLPLDRPRVAGREQPSATVALCLAPDLSAELGRFSQRQGLSLYMSLLAAFGILLARWTGHGDVVVTSPIANRQRREVEPLIGLFINGLALRLRPGPEAPLVAYLGETREMALGAYAHQELPFDLVVADLRPNRDLLLAPMFHAMLVLQNVPRIRWELPGLAIERRDPGQRSALIDLSLIWNELPEGLQGKLTYNAGLFDRTTCQRFLSQLETLLRSMIAAPQLPLGGLASLAAAESQQLLVEWAAAPPAAAHCALHERIAAAAAAWPESIAVVGAGEEHLSYAGLLQRAGAVRAALAPRPEAVIGVLLERTPDLIASLLGVLSAGAAYLPLDPATPSERVAQVLADAGAAGLVSQRSRGGSLAGLEVPLLMVEELAPSSAPAAAADPLQLAYVVYTSGSTGRPKGVMIPHRALAAFAVASALRFDLGPGDRVLQFASASFDTSAEEIYPALLNGATLVLREDAMLASPARFLAACAERRITMLDLPTAWWHELAAALGRAEAVLPAGLRVLVIGGERAVAARAADWSRAAGAAVVTLNTYGPTEATVAATTWAFPRRAWDSRDPLEVPIGRPNPGVVARVVDHRLRPVPLGVPGELLLGGVGLARGYLGLPGRTAESFVPDPFSSAPGQRLYRSGDRVRFRRDGELEYLGRADRQLKVRGFRVEPREVEEALAGHPAVRQVLVLPWPQEVDATGHSVTDRLVAYLEIGEGAAAPQAAELAERVRRKLPEPMVPAAFVFVPALPLTSRGKVDVARLPPVEGAANGHEEPATEVERLLARLWCEVLEQPRVGRQDHFFALGGHSLRVTQLIARLERDLDLSLPLRTVFERPRLADLAIALEDLLLVTEEAGSSS